MITAVAPLVMVPAVTGKVTVAAPDGTLTEACTGNALALLESVTVMLPEEGAGLTATVQVDEAPLLSDVGLHDSPVRAGDGFWDCDGSVIVPPVPVTDSGLPAAVAPVRFESPTGVVMAELDIVTSIVATTPLCSNWSFVPVNWHVKVPVPWKQVTVLFAALELVLGTALMEAMLAAVKVSVH